MRTHFLIALATLTIIVTATGCVSRKEKEAYVKGCANGIVAVLAQIGAGPAWDKINEFCATNAEVQTDARPPAGSK